MPYSDQAKKRAYYSAWQKNNRHSGANGETALRVEKIVGRYGPIGPSDICMRLGKSNPNAIGVMLDRLKHAGRVERIGYGRWISKEGS